MARTLQRLFLALALGAVMSARVAPARAQREDAAMAEKLFVDGRASMARGTYAEACAMLAESQRIDPGVGTLLTLGDCYEKLGKTASAWATYREAAPMARRLGQKERAAHAAARAQALSETLSYVIVRMANQPRGLSITLDDKSVAEAVWSTPIPVDPGRHIIGAAAPGKRSSSVSVEIRSAGRMVVDLPELAASPMPPNPSNPMGGPEDRGGTQRVVGWGAVVAGGLAIGTGVAIGIIAKSKNDEADAEHCSSAYCDSRGVVLLRDAKSTALASTILFAAGAATLATGIVLVITAPAGRHVTLAPYGAGAVVATSW